MGRLRGCLWLTAGLVVAVLAGAVAFMTLQKATAASTVNEVDVALLVPVVVASQDVAVPLRSGAGLNSRQRAAVLESRMEEPN